MLKSSVISAAQYPLRKCGGDSSWGLLSRRESAVPEVGIGTSIKEKVGEPVPGVTVERWGMGSGKEGAEVGQRK